MTSCRIRNVFKKGKAEIKTLGRTITIYLLGVAFLFVAHQAGNDKEVTADDSPMIWPAEGIGGIAKTIVERPIVEANTGVESDSDYKTYLPITLKLTNLLFFDDFSDPASGWPVKDNGDIKWSYQNEEYEILLRTKNWWAGAIAPVDGLVNYSVEAMIHRSTGSKSDYGLIFDFVDWDNFYVFAVDPGAQWYGVIKIIGGSVEVVVPATNTNLIKPDNTMNHLKVERDGDHISINVNGSYLASAFDAGFSGDLTAGLYVESDSDAPASARYDNFAIWKLGIQESKDLGLSVRRSGLPSTKGGDCFSGFNRCVGNGVESFYYSMTR